MSDYALDVDVGLLLPSDFLFDVLHPFPSDAELERESNSFFEVEWLAKWSMFF